MRLGCATRIRLANLAQLLLRVKRKSGSKYPIRRYGSGEGSVAFECVFLQDTMRPQNSFHQMTRFVTCRLDSPFARMLLLSGIRSVRNADPPGTDGNMTEAVVPFIDYWNALDAYRPPHS